MGDDRGSLISLEGNHNIPFDIKRVYYIFETNPTIRRGRHAHKNLQQIAICIKGSCKFFLDNGLETKNLLLDSPTQGLLLKGLVWREMYDFSSDCVLMILASEHYDERDYIRNYNQFLEMVTT